MTKSRAVRREKALTLEEARRALLPPRVLVATPHAGIADALRQDGFLVDEAHDGHELARLAGAFGHSRQLTDPYDLLIADARLPGPGALDILRAIREIDWIIHIVVLNEDDHQESLLEAERIGATVFGKAFDVRELRRLVRTTLPQP